MELENLDSLTEDTITAPINSEDHLPEACFLKGDVIYHAKPENINMLRKNLSTQRTDTRPSSQSSCHTDTVNTGESLFKVFTFEQSSNDEDTEKCIAFWKSVMKKNLTPIKCTIIENTKNPTPLANQKLIYPEEEEKSSHATSDDVAEGIHQEYRNMWLSALREIQKKKLHEIKLTSKSRCKMCDSISSSVEGYAEKVDKQAIKKEIKELNNWKSKSTKKQRQTPKGTYSGMKTNSSDSLVKGSPLTESQQLQDHAKHIGRASAEQMDKQSNASTGILEKTDTGVLTSSTREKNKKNLVPDTKTYIHQDVIGEKKKNGVYSKWRCNTLEDACQCRKSDCSCNINPAVVEIAKTESDSTSCVKDSLLKTHQCKPAEDQPKSETFHEKYPLDKKAECNAEQKEIRVDRNATRSTSSLTDQKNTEKMSPLRRRNLSLFLQCVCSTSSCDCGSFVESSSRKRDSELDWEIPKPTVIPIHKRRSSLELYRKTFSTNKLLSRKKGSFSSVDGRVPENTVSSTRNGSTREYSLTKSLNSIQAIRAQPSSRKLGKSISLMLRHCNCSNEDCDCYQIETIGREPSREDFRDFVVPSKMVVKPVDSLELTKKRLSMIEDPVQKSSVEVLYPPSSFGDDSSVLNEN